jgi:hypothetical protein
MIRMRRDSSGTFAIVDLEGGGGDRKPQGRLRGQDGTACRPLRPFPKRYEQELQEERSMPAPATHEDTGGGTEDVGCAGHRLSHQIQC